MEGLSAAAAAFVREYGEVGMAVAMGLNCLGVPFPSEVLLPLSGLAAQQGQMRWWVVAPAVILAQVAGLVLSYRLVRWHMGRRSRWRRWLKNDHLAHLEALLARGGLAWVLFALCMPGLHGLAGYAAGVAKLPFGRFVLVAFIGVTIWSLALMGIGYFAGENLDRIATAMHGFGAVMLGVAGGAWLVWYYKHHRKNR